MNLKSPIMQMFDSERGCYEAMKNSKEYFRLFRISVDKDNEFKRKLTAFPELLSLYEEVSETSYDMHEQYSREMYSEGFRFGFLLAMDIFEVIKEEDNLL